MGHTQSAQAGFQMRSLNVLFDAPSSPENQPVIEEPLVTLDKLTVGYERQPLLRDINLQLGRGRFIGLLGANGSGKSTLLKTVLGILPPLAGRIAFAPINGCQPVLGYVPQRETLDSIYPLSSFEVALMGVCGRVQPGRAIPKAEREWVGGCLEQTGVQDVAPTRFSQLSGGQRQRVLIARALAAKPDFLVLDEPTAGIDAAATQAIMELLSRLHAERQLTILMVSHDLAAVRRSVEEIVWLHQGKVLHGPVADLLSSEMIEAILELELH